ncbi:F0F1 ATP synthase subunit B [Candidatus Peregrinibacteria bacterium]|nr:F0F1 ATP synthase subunit B [Candidatus Peregrinibacteria bacterium]
MKFTLYGVAHAHNGEDHSMIATTETLSTTTEHTETETEHSGGLSIDPAIVGFQALNFLVLLIILHLILYKPLLKLLQDREKKIREGVENAEKAELLLTESTASREKMLKEARAEGQGMIENARQTGEQVRTELIAKAQEEAQNLINAGKTALDQERSKALSEVKAQAVDLVLKTTEKLLREKMDVSKDSALVKEALESFAK